MKSFISSSDLKNSIEDTFKRMPSGKRFKVKSVTTDNHSATIVFVLLSDNAVYGAKLRIPSTTADPLWQRISPSSIDEWVEYGIFWPIIEELDTGGVDRSAQSLDDGVRWLNLHE